MSRLRNLCIGWLLIGLFSIAAMAQEIIEKEPGLFSTKEAANSHLEALREKGVKSAKVGERNSKPPSVVLELRGPKAQAEALWQTLIEVLPESKPLVCKPATQ